MATTTRHEITIKPVLGALADASHLLLQAAGDPDRPATMLIEVASEEEARQWWETNEWQAWVAYVDGNPAGLLSVHHPDLDGDSEEYSSWLETDMWVAPEFRRHGVASRAWEQIMPELAGAAPGLIAEIWEENQTSITWHKHNGYEAIGRAWWDGSDVGMESGWCVRYSHALPQRRETEAPNKRVIRIPRPGRQDAGLQR